jgi:ATP-dependent helicase YprA (DUF1998 family)
MLRAARFIGSIADIRRKLRAVAALAENAGATEHERANAKALKARLLQRLKEAGEPTGDWTDNAFRLGKRVRELRSAISPAAPKGDWTDNAFRLGKAMRRGYKKWL